MMEKQGAHLIHLVDDLLKVSRITSGKIELRTQHVDLAAVTIAAVPASHRVLVVDDDRDVGDSHRLGRTTATFSAQRICAPPFNDGLLSA